MYDHVHDVIHHIDLIRVAVKAYVDDAGIACVTLNTYNREIFNLTRQTIREYTGLQGLQFDTYSKLAFVKRNSASIYVAYRHRRYIHRRLFRALFTFYPELSADYTMQHRYTYTDDLPGNLSAVVTQSWSLEERIS